MSANEKVFEIVKLTHDKAAWTRELEKLPPHEQLQRRFAIAMLELVDAELKELCDA